MPGYYVNKCPMCGEQLEHDDIDYNFEGNQDELSYCNKCHLTFWFYIRYHHLWKYDYQRQYYDEQYKEWLTDEGTEPTTVYVYKKRN